MILQKRSKCLGNNIKETVERGKGISNKHYWEARKLYENDKPKGNAKSSC